MMAISISGIFPCTSFEPDTLSDSFESARSLDRRIHNEPAGWELSHWLTACCWNPAAASLTDPGVDLPGGNRGYLSKQGQSFILANHVCV